MNMLDKTILFLSAILGSYYCKELLKQSQKKGKLRVYSDSNADLELFFDPFSVMNDS
jgi:hypothetical protein